MTGNPLAAAGWTDLRPGTELTIVKLAPAGNEAARYPGRVLDRQVPAGWLAARATWAHGELNIDGLRMIPGDTIDEYFSATAWFNAFEVMAPSGAPRGWYANVTYPATIERTANGPTLVWHDLYLDVIVVPNGRVTVRDEDELAASGLGDRDEQLYDRILASRDRLLKMIQDHSFPFNQRKE